VTACFMIAAAHKSSGKTVVSTGLARAMHNRGLHVQTFKKGPDYIDPMWLHHASNQPCYNLDFNTMPALEIRDFFANRAQGADIALIESNKGLFDGVDLHGKDSNAALAQLLHAPTVLVVDTTGTTRGIAPLLLGYQSFAKNLHIAGIILNKVGGARHEAKLRAAIAEYTDMVVLGAVARTADLEIGERHLGLTTPRETGKLDEAIDHFAARMESSINIDTLLEIGKTAPALVQSSSPPVVPFAQNLRIGIARDTAFGFYYPDDLEAMGAMGAELVFFDARKDPQLPQVDGLFIGGGFPETSAAALSQNTTLRQDIRMKISAGLPVYAECGGLMYLCETLKWQGETYPMVGAIPGDAVMCARPQGRGYTRLMATENCPWPLKDAVLNAHEFHYARIENLPKDTKFAFNVERGAGVDGMHDGIMVNNLLAGFCHMRNTSTNPWVERFLRHVKRCSQ